MHFTQRTYSLATCLTLTMSLTQCVAPLNSVFESAKLLEKGELEVQGNYSKYYYNEDISEQKGQNNFGLGFGYGLSNNTSLKLRYERAIVPVDFYSPEDGTFGTNFIELSSKFELKKDKIAFAIPLSFNFSDKGKLDMFYFRPRFLFTYSDRNNKFEINVIPKAGIAYVYQSMGVSLGLNLGLAFSNDLSKWAIRPEIGFDGFFNFGLGTNFYFNKKTKD